jgi:class 3 adenylate cyclase
MEYFYNMTVVLRQRFLFFFAGLYLAATQAAGDGLIDSLESAYFRFEQDKAFEKAATTALLIGDTYLGNGSYEQARKYFEYAYQNCKKEKLFDLGGRSAYKMARTLVAMSESGKYTLDQEQEYYDGAMRWYNWADELFEKSPMAESYQHQLTLIEMGEMEHYRGEYDKSKAHLDKALRFSQKHKNYKLALRAVDMLIEDCKRNAAYSNDLPYYESIREHYRTYFMSQDSLVRQMDTIRVLKSQTMEQSAALMEKEEILQLKQNQLDQQLMLAQEQRRTLEAQEKNQQYLMIIIIAITGVLLLSLYSYISIRRSKTKLEEKNRQILHQKAIIEKRQKELTAEKAKTERLLLNILPEPVAEELKKTGKVAPRLYDHVTVLFSDFKGFTSIASTMPAAKMIRELEVCFSAFDKIVQKYNLEKIKTIGDGYMCAGGVPIANKTNPLEAIKAALDMIDFMRRRMEQKMARGEPFFEIRIGINTGPVIAGIVGEKKFAYDIWGDTVNLASRLETGGQEWQINISENTYRYVKDDFFFTYRGKIDAKNKGEIDMYFVDGKVRYSRPATGSG